MFNQQRPTFGTGFGTANTSTASPFGQSAFNKPATTGFGTTPGFGQQQQQTSIFGAASNTTQTGLFNAGTSSAFGQTAQPTAFGSTFGAVQPQPQQPGTSLFGSTQPQQNTSLFGAQPTQGFGAKPAGFGGFGQPQATTGLFGQPAPTGSNTGTGFFSQPTQAPLFGGANTAAQGFGVATAAAPVPGQQNAGTSIAKYQPTTDSDTIVVRGNQNNVNTKQHCITFMKEYAACSLEELRLDDYMANRKGPQAGSSGLFGQQQQTGGIFGATQPATGGLFGQPQTSTAPSSLFGQQQNTMGTPGFGQAPGGFGQTTQASTSIFGAAKPFGAATTSTTTGFGGFGGATTSTPFGPKPAFGGGATTGLFGQPAAPGFGQTQQPQTGFGFGQQQPQQQQQQQQQAPSLFGQPQTSSAFGATNTTFSGFGATSTATTGLFGQQQKPTTGFGGFGANTQTSSAFGAGTGFGQQPAGGGLFSGGLGQKPAATGFTGFGQTSQPQAPTLGSSFGASFGGGFGGAQNTQKPTLFGQTQSTGLFGQSGTSFGGGNTLGGFGAGGGGGFGLSNPNQAAQPAATNVHQQIMNLVAFPYGDNPIYKDLKATVNADALKTTNTAAQIAALESATKYKVSPVVSTIKVKPIGGLLAKKSIFDGLEEYDASLEESFTLKPNPKRLILKPKASPKPLQPVNADVRPKPAAAAAVNESFNNQISSVGPTTTTSDDRRASWLQTAALDKIKEHNQGRVSDVGVIETTMKDYVAPQKSPADSGSDLSFTRGGEDSFLLSKSDDVDRQPLPAGITLTRPGYYTIPGSDELAQLVDDGRCVVPNFLIGRTGYGNVYYDEPIDVAGLNLDEIVHFRHREVIIYPDDENKPPVGEGLNRKAQITLDKVWPQDKTLHEPIKDPERLATMDFEGKLRRVCDKADTRFLEYRPDTGSWVFKVDHFSKYGLADSDEDEPVADPKKFKPNDVPPQPLKAAASTPIFEKQPSLQKVWPPFPEQQDFAAATTSFNLSQSNAILQRMEVDSHKLQAMKSSFFADEEYDNQSVVSDTSESSSLADQIVPKWGGQKQAKRYISPMILSSISENGRDDEEEDALTTSGSVKSVEKPVVVAQTPKTNPLHVKAKVFTEAEQNMIIPMRQSVIYRTNMKINSIFFNGRRFKVGWGPYSSMQFINGAAVEDAQIDIGKYCSGRLDEDYSANLVKRVQFPCNSRIKRFAASIVPHLEIQLKHDKITRAADLECPFFEANGGVKALPEHVATAQQLAHSGPLDEYAASVWTLCQSLWGEREELEGVEELSHTAVMFRRDMFSEWIEDVITDAEIVRIPTANQYLDQLLDLLYAHKVADACELTMKYDDYNLSLLLAQLSGGQTIKQLVKHQLAMWQDVQADKFIDARRLRAFMIVAGLPVFHSTQGMINIYDDMDWIKVLAFHLWYFCSPTSSITDVVLSYEKTLETTENDEISPRPPYIRSHSVQTPRPIKDLRHHLLHLYSRRTHPLEQLLNPATHTADPLDFRLSWLLLQFLESIGYTHCSELVRSRIFTSFADQLENYGLWHWAIYILLHIRERARRESTIKAVLLRHIEIEFEPEYIVLENFIVDKLGIPETWIYAAKAVRAGSLKRYNEQAKFLLHAKEWNLAHEVIITHIAPSAILNDKIPFLKMLLNEFKDPKKVSNWNLQGKVLLDFIEINEAVENLKFLRDDDIDTALDELKSKFGEVSTVIKHFPCPTAKHRLCQSEIAQRIAFLIRSFYATNGDFTPRCALLKMSLEKLPLPPEYARTELKTLLTAFLNEQLKI